jgi:hypothetical protein
MVTYQDLEKVGDSDKGRIDFVFSTIAKHKTTPVYRDSVIADEYDSRKNTTICHYQKLLYTMSGEAVPDNYSANHKTASNFYKRFVTQEMVKGFSLVDEALFVFDSQALNLEWYEGCSGSSECSPVLLCYV